MSGETRSVLLFDDYAQRRRSLHSQLTASGYRVYTVGAREAIYKLLNLYDVDLVLVEESSAGPHLEEIATKINEQSNTATQLHFSIMPSAGAEPHGYDWTRLVARIERASIQSRNQEDARRLLLAIDETASADELLLGASPQMLRVRRLVQSVSSSAAPVLVLGESGTGKELVARSLHQKSGRKGQFVGINCALLPSELIEGELFGWEKGAHSTAAHAKMGLFEVAGEGTLLLDEIGEMPVALQAKLLRVLESRTFRRLGATGERPLKARVVAATNRDLTAAIENGTFRQDLLYRLNVVTIQIPPLRDRKSDISHLAYHFVAAVNAAESRSVQRIEARVFTALNTHNWPGNVRELRNVIHRAILLGSGDTLRYKDLPTLQRRRDLPSSPESVAQDPHAHLVEMPFREAKEALLGEFMRTYLCHHLRHGNGVITKAAVSAGLLRPNFRRLMTKYNVTVAEALDE
jgi:DNA-binding NtrC family response regulator